MTFEEFKSACLETIQAGCDNYEYLSCGLAGESGEVVESFKKYLRKDYGIDEVRKRITSELGDVLWYTAMLLRNSKLPFNVALVSPTNGLLNAEFNNNEMRYELLMLNKHIAEVAHMAPSITDYHLHLILFKISNLVPLSDCYEVVIEKLRGRKKADTIQGDGEGVRDGNDKRSNSRRTKTVA